MHTLEGFGISRFVFNKYICVFQICESPDCVSVAGAAIQNMNLSVDPCDDFYTYSCGLWVENTIMPPEQPKWGTFGELAQRNEGVLKRVRLPEILLALPFTDSNLTNNESFPGFVVFLISHNNGTYFINQPGRAEEMGLGGSLFIIVEKGSTSLFLTIKTGMPHFLNKSEKGVLHF